MRLKTFTSIILTIFILTSCSNRPKTIGFVLPHLNATRYNIEKDEFIKKVKESGGEVIFLCSDNDELKQQQQVNELLKKGIDVLVLDPVNRFRAAAMVRAAHDKGVPVISYDRLIVNCEPDAFLSFDAEATGTKMAQYALNLAPSGKYVLLNGDKSDLNAVLVEKALQKNLEPAVKSGKISVVYSSFIEFYSIDESRIQLQKYLDLTMDLPDVILCSSDMIAKGAMDAIRLNSIQTKIIIIGQGAELYACKEILNGNQSMTIYKPVKKLAELSADIALKLAKGANPQDLLKNKIFNGSINVPSIFLDVITVDKSNLKSTVVADGLIKEGDLIN